MPKAPKIIVELIEIFERDIVNYKSPAYNETQLRTDFVNPFWKALGWDMTNEAGYAIPYRDVKQEFPLKVGLTTKAPDYCFTIAGKPKFFLETKKPSVDVKHEIHPAYQLRRYGWSGKLPLSILTDFEEMAVYDCRIRPKKNDKSSIARINYYTFQEYIDKWDDIESVFSRDAVLKGSFDKYVESKKGKRGTSEVDTEFLKEIEKWREELARNIALRNPSIDIRGINFAVQRTIDRIIFLRMCEDRGIEDYSQLRNLCSRKHIYKRLVDIFKNADDKYNSGLFHFKEESGRKSIQDTLTPNIRIDDKIIKEILARLYYPESPYEFSFMPAEILGNVYEQFLGKVIRLTKGHQAKVEEKPEVRKAGGVYYTPAYIVDYIVENTVGKLCDGKKPKDISKLKILDPACGSGSFLLGAYQFLLDYHLKYYTDEMEKTGKVPKPPTLKPMSQSGKGKRKRDRQAIYQGQDGGWYLTTTEKKRILLNNIYGVDIDSQAVEVTKLSLLLKVLENENKDTLHQQLFLIKERALPDLSDNIKCGNSLIGSDFYTQSEQTLMFDDEEQYRINAFDWDVEFADIMKGANGGFDAVIGNPPYGAVYSSFTHSYLQKSFKTFVFRGESYLVFVEKAINLLKTKGVFGYIIPDTYLNLGFTKALRGFLFRHTNIKEIVLLPSNVFLQSTVDTTLLFVQKNQSQDKFNESNVNIRIFNKKDSITSLDKAEREFKVSTSIWFHQDAFNVQSDQRESSIILRIDAEYRPLSDLAEMYSGIKGYEVGKGNPPQSEKVRKEKPFHAAVRIDKSWSPLFDGKHIGRYQLLWIRDNWVKYGEWLAAPRKKEQFAGEKILIRKIVGQTLITTYIPETSYCNTLLFILKLKPSVNISYLYLLGILNSRFIGWFYRKKFQITTDDTFPQIMIRDILQFAIPLPSIKHHDKMVKLVDNMLSLHKRIQDSKTPHEREMIQRRIVATDRQIDNLVYELYGLSDEEIAVVEGS